MREYKAQAGVVITAKCGEGVSVCFLFCSRGGIQRAGIEKAKRSSMEDEWRGAGRKQESLREQAR